MLRLVGDGGHGLDADQGPRLMGNWLMGNWLMGNWLMGNWLMGTD